jgi:hypothetical protein
LEAKPPERGISLFVNAEQLITLEKMFILVKTTPYTPK